MRILHLASYSLYSGPVPSTLGLALSQRALGHTVWFNVDTKRGAINDFEEPALPRLLPHAVLPPAPLVLSTKSSPRELWRDLRALRRLVLDNEVDVVHAHLSHDHALLAACPAKKGFARVRSFHAARSLAPRPLQGFVNRRADAWIVRDAAQRELLHERFGLPSARTHVVAGGIDARAFSPASEEERQAARARFGLPENALVVGQVALMASRGQVELVSALALLPEPRPYLLFVGRGEHEDALRAHVAKTGMTPWVRFAGYLLGAELRTGYAAMDGAFLAQAGNDASARAALEAMAMGVPLVAVSTGALGELCTTARGYPVASRAPADIAAGVGQLFAGRAEAQKRALAARAYVEQERTFEREAAITLGIYSDVLG